MKSIVTIGEILVEIMATERGDGFLEPIGLIGPFPSGAPAIFIDQAARFGQPAAMIGCVGDDDFGRVNLERLARDGVDVSAIAVDPEAATGSAFVRYRSDGTRAFVFNIKHSASGRIVLGEAARAVIGRSDHLHIMGTALFSPAIVEVVLAAAEAVKGRGGTISFDPNLRPEMLGLPGLRDACETLFRRCDLYLPSGDELVLFTEVKQAPDAIAEMLGRGIRAVVHKQGAEGATYHDAAGSGSSAWLPGRRGRPHWRRRLLWSDLRVLLAARLEPARVPGLCGRQRGLRGDAAWAHGGCRNKGRTRPLPGRARRRSPIVTCALPTLVQERLTEGAAGIASICTAHPVAIEATLRLD